MFNYFDVLTIFVILGLCYLGFRTGIVSNIFYVSSGFIGMFVAHKFYKQLEMDFHLFFISVALCVMIIGFFIGKALRDYKIGRYDRGIGAFLGLILGVLITTAVTGPVFAKISDYTYKMAYNSISGKYIIRVVQKVFPNIKELKLRKVKEMIDKSEIASSAGLKVLDTAEEAVKQKKKDIK
ncbi:CvpA family protein [Elusimicrobiota bacterium]